MWPWITFLCTSQQSYRSVLKHCLDRLCSWTLTAETIPVSGQSSHDLNKIRLSFTNYNSNAIPMLAEEKFHHRWSPIILGIPYFNLPFCCLVFVFLFYYLVYFPTKDFVLIILCCVKIRLCCHYWILVIRSLVFLILFDSSSTPDIGRRGPARSRALSLSDLETEWWQRCKRLRLNRFLNRTPSDCQQEFWYKTTHMKNCDRLSAMGHPCRPQWLS